MNANVSKTNGVKLLAVVAVLAMVVCTLAVIMPAEQTNAATENTQSYSGVLDGEDVNQTFPLYTNVIIYDDLTITNGAKMYVSGNLTINAGVDVTISNGGELIIGKANADANVADCLVTNNGAITVNGEGSKIVVNAANPSDYDETGVINNGTISVIRGGSLEGTTVGENGTSSILVNNGGSLNVTSTGSRISTISGLNVDVAVGGTFRFDGRAGETAMTVTSYGTGDNRTNSSATITKGETSEGETSTSDLTFTTTSRNYTAYPDTDPESGILMREYALNVDGSVNGNDSITFSGTVIVNKTTVDGTPGSDGTDYYTSEDAAKQTPTQYWTFNDYVMGTVNIASLDVNNGSVLTVGSSAYVIVETTLNVDLSTKTDDENNTVTPVLGTFVIDGIVEVVGTVTTDGQTIKTTTEGNYTKGTIAINGGEVTFTNGGNANSLPVAVYGAIWIDDDDDETAHITDLASAIADAQAAGIDDVTVVGLQKSFGRENNQDSFNGRGAYLVDSNITIPDDMVLTIICGMKIAEGVEFTVNENAAISFTGDYSGIWVEGKLIDYDTILDSELVNIMFEVMSQVITDDYIVNTYTTFATALAETTEGTIYLYDDIEIDRNMTIPENVTVQFATKPKDATAGITFEPDTKYTFTVNGELYLSNGHNFNTAGGTVVVNNVIRSDATGVAVGDITDPENLKATIAGAYFAAALEENDTNLYNYIASVKFAAENSANIDNGGQNVITIFGDVVMGDVTFTKGENVANLSINILSTGDDMATGNVTLVNGVAIEANSVFDGTITMETTSGTAVIDMDEAYKFTITQGTEETADGTQTAMVLGSMTGESPVWTIRGTVTIQSGTVEINSQTIVNKLVVADGATLNVNAQVIAIANPDYKFNTTSSNLPVFTEEFIANTAGLVLDGTMVVDENASVESIIAHIGGNVTVDGSLYTYLSCIDGTIAAGENGETQLAVALLNGTVSGDAVFEAVITFPGSNITDADLGEINSTVVYVNGVEFGTYYAKDNVAIESILLAMDVDGVKIDTADFCTDVDMRNSFKDVGAQNDTTLEQLDAVVKAIQKITNTASLNGVKNALNAITGTAVGIYSEVYIGMEPADVHGTITVYQGMNLYIDGQAIGNFMELVDEKYVYVLPVGTHQFSVQVDPGFSGTPVVTLDGQTVSGSFTISNDAQSFQIVVTGDITQNPTVVEGGDNGGSDNLGLTDYLLIILVILIVVMAIMVAMRLMRS